jgi:ADP-ribose pyrophosphatase
MSEKLLQSERIYDGKVISLRVDTVEFDNGKSGKREVIEHHGAVAIVPMIDDKHVFLVSQFRTPAAKALLEIPAGSINKGEDPDTCAHRELVEEISYRAGSMERLFGMFAAPGYSTEYITVYLARDLTPEPGVGDEDEFIEVRKVRLEDAIGMIESGEIEDAKSIAGLLAVSRRTS